MRSIVIYDKLIVIVSLMGSNVVIQTYNSGIQANNK